MQAAGELFWTFVKVLLTMISIVFPANFFDGSSCSSSSDVLLGL